MPNISEMKKTNLSNWNYKADRSSKKNKKIVIGYHRKSAIKEISWPSVKYSPRRDKFRTSDLKPLVKNIKEFLMEMKNSDSLIIKYAGNYFGFDNIISKCDKIIDTVNKKSFKIRYVYNLCGNDQDKSKGVYSLPSLGQHAIRLSMLLKEIKKHLEKKLEYIIKKNNSNEKKIFENNDLAYNIICMLNENSNDYADLVKDTNIKSSINELEKYTNKKVDFDKYNANDISCFIGFVYHLDDLIAQSYSLSKSLNDEINPFLLNIFQDLCGYYERKIKLKDGDYKVIEAFLKSTKKMLRDVVSIEGVKENGLFSDDEYKKFKEGIMHKYKKGEAKKLLKDLKNTIEKNTKNSMKKAKKEFKNNKDGLSKKVLELGKIEDKIYIKINEQMKALNTIKY